MRRDARRQLHARRRALATSSTTSSRRALHGDGLDARHGLPVTGPRRLREHGRQNSAWATIVWWYASKLSLLCQKLLAIPDDGGETLLDNSVVWFGSGQIEEWNGATTCPSSTSAAAAALLKVNQFVPFRADQSLSNVYLTFLRNVFGFGMVVPDTSFGDSTGIIPEILA